MANSVNEELAVSQ